MGCQATISDSRNPVWKNSVKYHDRDRIQDLPDQARSKVQAEKPLRQSAYKTYTILDFSTARKTSMEPHMKAGRELH